MPCNKWGWPQVLTSPGMAFQAVERSHSQPLDPWIYPPTQGQSQIEGLGWDSHDNNPVGCWLDWYICIHTHRKEKFGNSSSLLLDGIGEFFGRLFWKKNPYEKMVVQTKKLQKLQPINQFVESIFFWPSLKKNPKNSGPSAPKTKDQETSPGSFISKKKWFPKKILQTKKSIKQFQETYSKFRSFSQKKQTDPKISFGFPQDLQDQVHSTSPWQGRLLHLRMPRKLCCGGAWYLRRGESSGALIYVVRAMKCAANGRMSSGAKRKNNHEWAVFWRLSGCFGCFFFVWFWECGIMLMWHVVVLFSRCSDMSGFPLKPLLSSNPRRNPWMTPKPTTPFPPQEVTFT